MMNRAQEIIGDTMSTIPNNKRKTFFLGGVQQSEGSERVRRVRLACFSFETMVGPNRAPTPTNSSSSVLLIQVCTFTWQDA